MTSALMKKVQSHPNQTFKFIVLGSKGAKGTDLAQVIKQGGFGKDVHAFSSIPGATATISGAQLQRLALLYPKLLQSVTLDKPVHTAEYQNAQMWTASADVSPLWSNIDPNTGADLGPAPQAPAIAIIDSGINTADTANFGSRILGTVSFCSLCGAKNAGDTEGHGTMVAGIAAGSGPNYPGVAQNAPIVSVKVANGDGESMESDVIAACDWILANKDKYGVKVVNISMSGSSPASFRADPLDQAVERLWFAGVTVVAASGNFGTGSAVDMSAAPGNDPFIITVGAVDQNQSSDPSDDTITPWSAFGYTADGFSKPDMVAPGRYMVMPVPLGATIPTAVPDRVVEPGYMWMSGTSFASPVVAGAAAQILARHPDWTPGPGEGRPHADGGIPAERRWSVGGRRRGRCGHGGQPRLHPAEPEREPRHVRVDGSDDGQAGVQRGGLGGRGVHRGSVELCSLEFRGLGECGLGEMQPGRDAAWSSAAWSSSVNSAMSSLATYTEATYTP